MTDNKITDFKNLSIEKQVNNIDALTKCEREAFEFKMWIKLCSIFPINYYQLSAYMHPFLKKPQTNLAPYGSKRSHKEPVLKELNPINNRLSLYLFIPNLSIASCAFLNP